MCYSKVNILELKAYKTIHKYMLLKLCCTVMIMNRRVCIHDKPIRTLSLMSQPQQLPKGVDRDDQAVL